MGNNAHTHVQPNNTDQTTCYDHERTSKGDGGGGKANNERALGGHSRNSNGPEKPAKSDEASDKGRVRDRPKKKGDEPISLHRAHPCPCSRTMCAVGGGGN